MHRPSINRWPATLLGAVALLSALVPLAGWSQVGPTVTDQDIERTRAQLKQQMGAVTDAQVEAVRKRVIVPQQQGANDQALRAHRPQLPRLEAMPSVLVQPKLDIGALSGQFLSQQKPSHPSEVIATSKLYVFVTMAMPAEALKGLVAQAERARATLVLRGMVNNSMKQTGAAMRKLVGTHKVGFTIDPEAFDRYGITHAPSFVLTKPSVDGGKPCAEKQCAQSDGFALVAGDVSLDYALERIEQRAPRFKSEAQSFLKRMRG